MARVKGEIWEQTQGGSEETEPSRVRLEMKDV